MKQCGESVLMCCTFVCSKQGGREGGGVDISVHQDQTCAQGSQQQSVVHGLVQRQAAYGQLFAGRHAHTHTNRSKTTDLLYVLYMSVFLS